MLIEMMHGLKLLLIEVLQIGAFCHYDTSMVLQSMLDMVLMCKNEDQARDGMRHHMSSSLHHTVS
jgi:uncharacterized membrane protein